MRLSKEKALKLFGITCAISILQSCSLPQAVGYNISHSLGFDAPQQAPSITHEKRKIGKPYQVFGRWYSPIASSEGYRQYGVASWYGNDFHAKNTANGEKYNMYAYTAAHKTLPLPTYVRVTNTQNGKSIVVRVNDRGPFVKDRLIDMSYAGAKALGFDKQGTAPVLVEAISIHGGDVKRGLRPQKTRYANEQPQNTKQMQASRYRLTQNRPAVATQYNPNSSFTTRIANRDSQVNQTGNSYAPKPNSVAPAIGSKYFIQLGSFTDVNNARKLYYQAKNIEGIKIKSFPINGKTYHRVVVENIQTLQQAQEKLEMVKSRGFYNSIISSVK